MNPRIIRYAIEAHQFVNHLYGGAPYSVHLAIVAGFASKYIHLVEDVDLRPKIIDACWLHDTIEDCRLTYNDIKKVAGEQVADIVYAVSNNKGKTRKERANDDYYFGVRHTKGAVFVKICDRLANVFYSFETDSRMFDTYRAEYAEFVESLGPVGDYQPMMHELLLLTTGKHKA